MKIKDLHPHIKDTNFKDEILETEFSKSGLIEFHKNNPEKYLFVILMDEYSSVVFDKSGTFPGDNDGVGIHYDPTGAYINNLNGRKVNPDNVVSAMADVDNVFDYVNFFENGIDMSKLKKE